MLIMYQSETDAFERLSRRGCWRTSTPRPSVFLGGGGVCSKKVLPLEVRGQMERERGFYQESFGVKLFGEFSPQVIWDFIRRVQLQPHH